MTTLKEQMQERMDSRPDKHTLAWWNEQFTEVAKGYRGLTHAVNLVLHEIEDRDRTLKAMQTRADLQGEILEESLAAIGKLQAEVAELAETIEKARDAYSDLRKKISP